VTRQAGACALADYDRAGERALESREDVDQGGLAGAIWPNEPENLAAREPNADVVDGHEAAEADAHRFRRKLHARASARRPIVIERPEMTRL
jgi:hypothetical protein